MKWLLGLLVAAVIASSASAAPQAYRFLEEGSSVGFSWFLGSDEIKGHMPVTDADITIDFQRLRNSQVNVTLDVASANAGFPFASQSAYRVPWSIETPLTTPYGIADPAAAIESLRKAITSTREKYGRLDRPFGDVSRFQVDDTDLPGLGSFGNLGAFNVITWADPDGDNIRTPRHGETWVSMVEFSDPIKAYGIMTYGNSRQPGTSHYDDQVELLAKGEFRELWLLREQIEANAETRETLSRQP